MFRLFRRKIVSVVKYFRRNQFQKKLFSRKYFLAFGSHKKITKRENAAVAGIWQRRSGRISGRILSDQAGSRPFWPDQWPGLVISGRIPAGF